MTRQHHIRIPKPLTLVGPEGEPVMTFVKEGDTPKPMAKQVFLLWFCKRLEDPQLSKTAADLFVIKGIKAKVSECDGEWLSITDDEYRFADPAIETPTGGFNNEHGFADQMTPFFTAWRDSVSERPPEALPLPGVPRVNPPDDQTASVAG